MATLMKLFAVIFFIGFIVYVSALGLGGMAGELLSDNPNLVGLRTLGLAFMAGGLALWIGKRRTEGGKPGLNPLIGMLVLFGLALAILAAVWAPSLADIAGPAALGFTVAALLVGLLAMLIAPAGAQPLTAHWPEGGESPQLPHVPATELHHDEPTIGELDDHAAH